MAVYSRRATVRRWRKRYFRKTTGGYVTYTGWQARILVGGVCHTKVSKDREAVEEWLRGMLEAHPTYAVTRCGRPGNPVRTDGELVLGKLRRVRKRTRPDPLCVLVSGWTVRDIAREMRWGRERTAAALAECVGRGELGKCPTRVGERAEFLYVRRDARD